MKFKRFGMAALSAMLAAGMLTSAALGVSAEELAAPQVEAQAEQEALVQSEPETPHSALEVGQEAQNAPEPGQAGDDDSDAQQPEEVFYPQITSFSTAQGGTRIAWEQPEGAVEYRLYVRVDDKWKGLIRTDKTFFYHNKLTNNTVYKYTLRAFDKDGKEIGHYQPEGFDRLYLDAPKLKAADSVYGGMRVSWNAVEGAKLYTVYRRFGSAWRVIAKLNDTRYLDEDVTSGESYSYTVRCFSEDGRIAESHYESKGVTGKYVESPGITGIINVADGAEINWGKVAGADRYRIFVKDGSSWKRLGVTEKNYFVHKGTVSNTVYTYTVRAMDKKDNYVSGHDDGTSSRFFSVPVMNAPANVYGGVKISWKHQNGVVCYKLYRKSDGSGWTPLGFTEEDSYIDDTAVSGNTYAYTVRAVTAERNKAASYYDKKGKSIQYFKAPEISNTDNYNGGVKLYFTSVTGAAKYRAYVRQGGKWINIGTTTNTNLMYSEAKSGVTYTFTVRALDSKNNFVTGYNPDGFKATFYSAPVVSAVSERTNGYEIFWNAVGDCPLYRVYRKTFGGKWQVVGDTSNLSLTDTRADKNTLTAYTLRCLTADGRSNSGYVDSNVYYINGKLANGTRNVGGTNFVFVDGMLRQGFIKIDGKTYYYDSDGVLQKDGVVGNKTDGYYYADKNGVIDYSFTGIAQNSKGSWYCKKGKVDFTFRNAVTYGGSDWNVLDGKAYKVKTDSDRTLFRAFKELAKCTNSSMSKSEKLWAAFKYVQGAYTELNPRIPHYKGVDWPILYANDMFVDRAGNCLSYAAAYGYMAKAIGYENVYACHSGGHGWTEINGKVYDPEWGRHTFDKVYYALDYDTCTSPAYKTAISAGYAWMHVKL